MTMHIAYSEKQFSRSFNAYLETMLWITTDDGDKPLEDNYSVSDINPYCLKGLEADYRKFFAECMTIHAYTDDDGDVITFEDILDQGIFDGQSWDGYEMLGHRAWLGDFYSGEWQVRKCDEHGDLDFDNQLDEVLNKHFKFGDSPDIYEHDGKIYIFGYEAPRN